MRSVSSILGHFYLLSVGPKAELRVKATDPKPDSLVRWPLKEECLFMDIIVTPLQPRNMTTVHLQAVVLLEQFSMVRYFAAPGNGIMIARQCC